MSRTSFSSPETSIVVSSDGYFDVYAAARPKTGRPAYRGRLSELGTGIRGADDRLALRPSSPQLALAVTAWSSVYGAAAVRGELGKGRDGNEAAA
jgi:hypothetical protein